ncbi:hypothetical protein [Nonomuraea sediminis]|uniref:hypothetical protein n=1 Tax=Nonomuraea sediminis TaxID=2835864 RepID=UPI001BDCD714|nr:hypothetical protein [Nonomuraea sediminis]
MNTPQWLRALAGGALILAVTLGVTLAVAVSGVRDGLQVIGHRTGPQVVATQDLYFALNDMDAQVANVLLVGAARDLGVGRDKALEIYAARRTQASKDLQQAAAVGGGQTLADVIDGLGRYEQLAGQAILLDSQQPHPPGRPPAAALERYRQATDLMKSAVLPAADRLTKANAATIEAAYQDAWSAAQRSAVFVIVLGVLLAGVLVALQAALARRFHRLVNAFLAPATVGALLLTGLGGGLLISEAEHLRVAKKDAFDSVLALTQARGLSYDANADESRFLVDPSRSAVYAQRFLDKSQRLAGVPGATLDTYDAGLAGATSLTGYFGTALRNITFPGERERAEATMAAYRAYQLDDRKMRALHDQGRLRDAVALNTSYQPGNSNYHFDRYDKALEQFIGVNQSHFEGSIRDGEDALAGWGLIPGAGALLVAALTLAGVRPRLGEYRP